MVKGIFVTRDSAQKRSVIREKRKDSAVIHEFAIARDSWLLIKIGVNRDFKVADQSNMGNIR